ncbi:MAG: nucleotide sugar dehydrogenase [Gallionella sp.]|nr:nucleotide sugar dehydrogenase [Gallionella sp.]
MKQPVIGFVGMTHLGLVSGVSAAEKGFTLICFDPDVQRIAALQKGKLPVSEPQLDELVAKNAERLRFTHDAAALKDCDVIYVAPDVPTDDQGCSDLNPINLLLDIVFQASRSDAVIVVLSQVPPGFTRGKQQLGRMLYYQVETLIFGRAVERALFPERYIIGCADPAEPLPDAYRCFLEAHGCPILPMRYESAELAKISINMCLVASVSTANTLAELCEKIGADWSEIVPALKLDRRIGNYSYLAPGLGISGGNLERDLATVCRFAEKHGTDAGVVRAWLVNSEHRKGWPARTIRTELANGAKNAIVAVWGLAYKENTHSVKNSPSLLALSQLQDISVRLYDPVVSASVAQHPQALEAADPLEAATGADALMVLTPWPEFRNVAPGEIAKVMKGHLVVDPYSILDERAARAAGLRVVTLGRAAVEASWI